MRTDEIIKILENKFPKNNAEDWDNVGLIVGHNKKNVKKIQFSLDVTEKSIEQAIKHNIDMIISHHPMIFKSIKQVNDLSLVGNKILELAKHGINVYTLHTNLDASSNGLNDYILKRLDVKNSKIIDATDDGVGIGRYFNLNEEITISNYIDILKNSLKIDKVRFVGENIEKKIKKVAIINGSAMSYWKKVKHLNIDLFITGDISYHDALDAKEEGLSLVDFGHYESESFFYEIIKEELKNSGIEFFVFNDGPIFNFI